MTTAAVKPRPASDYDALALLELVAEVAAAADEPSELSSRAWDRLREPSGHPDAPAARRIAEHLGLPWAKVLELSQQPPRSRSQALGIARGEGRRDWVTPELISFVLNLMARRLRQTSVAITAYRREQAAMLRDDRRRWLHGRQLRLPTVDQIIQAAGSWPAALRIAGLPPTPPSPPQRAGVPILDVLNRCYEFHGTEATCMELEKFARANGIPFPRRERGKPWSEYVAEWKARRRERGLPVPVGPPPKAERPDYTQDVGAAFDGRHRTRKDWNDVNAVVAVVARYLDELPRGEFPNLRSYEDWTAGKPDAPAGERLGRQGGWLAVLALARKRRASLRP